MRDFPPEAYTNLSFKDVGESKNTSTTYFFSMLEEISE